MSVRLPRSEAIEPVTGGMRLTRMTTSCESISLPRGVPAFRPGPPPTIAHSLSRNERPLGGEKGWPAVWSREAQK